MVSTGNVCKWTKQCLVSEGYSQEFEVKGGVHQGSVLSPLLFIIMLKALSHEFRSGVLWEDHEEELQDIYSNKTSNGQARGCGHSKT